MEILTIVLSSLLSLASSGGVILDLLVGNNLRSQVTEVEEQAIRIDNTPSYQIVGGKLQKIRVATRGIKLKQNLRIEALELETDRIDLDRSKLDLDNIDGLRKALKQPLQGAAKIILTEVDLNRALQSPATQAQIQQILNRLIAKKAGSTNIAYQLIDPRLELLPNNRMGVQFKLRRAQSTLDDSNSDLAISLKLKVGVANGKALTLIDPIGTVNQRPMSSRLLNGFASGISDRFDLSELEADGILARLLQLKIDEDKIELAGFARMETKEAKLSSIKEVNDFLVYQDQKAFDHQ